jgi:5-methylthioadenosine/S-adenosylhomocysteine deaminase
MSMGFTKYRRQTGRSDVAYLKQLGVLDGRWLLKHGIHFTDEDIEAVRVAGSGVVYTPTSEAIRGGGLGPFGRMRALGVRCVLGSDGPAVDYSVDMVEQMRACCYMQAVRYGDAGAIEPHAALEMATIDAARALGLQNEIGSIEPGKQADLVLFDLSGAHSQAIADPVRRLIWTGRGSDAHTVFVQGAELLSCGRFTAWPKWQETFGQARQVAHHLAAKAGLAARAEPVWPIRELPDLHVWPGRSGLS